MCASIMECQSVCHIVWELRCSYLTHLRCLDFAQEAVIRRPRDFNITYVRAYLVSHPALQRL